MTTDRREEQIRKIFITNFDNNRYLWSKASKELTELIDQLLADNDDLWKKRVEELRIDENEMIDERINVELDHLGHIFTNPELQAKIQHFRDHREDLRYLLAKGDHVDEYSGWARACRSLNQRLDALLKGDK